MISNSLPISYVLIFYFIFSSIVGASLWLLRLDVVVAFVVTEVTCIVAIVVFVVVTDVGAAVSGASSV